MLVLHLVEIFGEVLKNVHGLGCRALNVYFWLVCIIFCFYIYCIAFSSLFPILLSTACIPHVKCSFPQNHATMMFFLCTQEKVVEVIFVLLTLLFGLWNQNSGPHVYQLNALPSEVKLSFQKDLIIFSLLYFSQFNYQTITSQQTR